MKDYRFSFEHIFDWNVRQKEVFEEISQLSNNSMTLDEIQSMNLYRPVRLSKKYNPYWLHIFKEYRKTVLRRDAKARASRNQSDLLIFLQDN